jgi:hypothetical protein
MNDGKNNSLAGRLIAALALASCLPLDDLSRYSRGGAPAAPDAGHQFTNATPGGAASVTPDPPSPPVTDGPPPREEDPSETPAESPPTPAEAPNLPPLADAGSPAPGALEGCIMRPEADTGAGSCYAISPEPSTWSRALVACAGWGGSLVSINSSAESDWLTATVDVTIWIGANDRQREGTFVWSNGDPFQFELFAAGEPDNTFGVQDCVERRVDSSWNDRVCSVENPFVCERLLSAE